MSKNDNKIIIIALVAFAIAIYFNNTQAVVDAGAMHAECGAMDSEGVITCSVTGGMDPVNTQVDTIRVTSFDSWYRVKNNGIMPDLNSCNFNGQKGTAIMSSYIISCNLDTPIQVTPSPPSTTIISGTLRLYFSNASICSPSCGVNEVCQNSTCISTCIPLTCSSFNNLCGSFSNGCGGNISCGCGTNKACNNGQCENTYQCIFNSDCASGKECRNGLCQNITIVNTTNNTTACVTNWTCAQWSSCFNNEMTRSCIDGNSCGSTTGKPVEWQSCSVPTCELYQFSTTKMDGYDCSLTDVEGLTCWSCKKQSNILLDYWYIIVGAAAVIIFALVKKRK
jgi:hypothetical protein